LKVPEEELLHLKHEKIQICITCLMNWLLQYYETEITRFKKIFAAVLATGFFFKC
jgi:hypothetical protein